MGESERRKEVKETEREREISEFGERGGKRERMKI